MSEALPVTLGDLGEAWRPFFHCRACGWYVGPAWFHLRRQLGTGYRLADLVRRISCQRCKAAGQAADCMLVIEPWGYATPGPGFRQQRYQLQKGGTWKPYNGR